MCVYVQMSIPVLLQNLIHSSHLISAIPFNLLSFTLNSFALD